MLNLMPSNSEIEDKIQDDKMQSAVFLFPFYNL